jgi:hypothetical protein
VESNDKFHSKTPQTPPVCELASTNKLWLEWGKKLVVVRELRNLGIEKKIFISREASKVAIHMMTRHGKKKEMTTHRTPWLDESEKLCDGHHVDGE